MWIQCCACVYVEEAACLAYPAACIKGHDSLVQNSTMAPYTRLIWGDAGSSSEPKQGKGKTGGRGLHGYLIEKVHTIGSQPLVGVFAWRYTHCCCNVATVQQGKCLETMAEVNQSSRVAHLPRVF